MFPPLYSGSPGSQRWDPLLPRGMFGTNRHEPRLLRTFISDGRDSTELRDTASPRKSVDLQLASHPLQGIY